MPDRAAVKVLLLGASGVFGSRLTQIISGEDGVQLTLAARGVAKLEQVAKQLRASVDCRQIDRDTLTALDFAGFDLVVDAAGPFQSSHMRVVECAMAAGVDYIDLADGRDFIRDFTRYDDVAKGAQVALTTGASSIPALSHAVLDELTDGWQAIDDIRVAIYPGNRAPRGLSVVEAILSYVGKPVRVFRDGEWREDRGWGRVHREDLPDIGKRWASVCDTPEQDLLVARYKPRRSAQFFAGMELSILHLGLAAMALPVRWGWVDSLRPLSKPMLMIAKWFLPFGSDKGGMSVKVSGVDADGLTVQRHWFLNADANRGPFTPVLAAAAMIRRYRDGIRPEAGARVCSGILTLNDFEADFKRLGITHRTLEKAPPAPADEARPALATKEAAWQ
ncbi:MAG: saccharopine dehydrogenase NADP-binding domain-containing protein [Pseudomonadota bacterium]|nr:saccharopine dehydrogenase NADP-binding domain-containing protein [Pseudomonadota bacterium]